MSTSRAPTAMWLPPRRVAAITDAVLSLARARCLTKTLVLQRILRRRGVETEVVVGVARDATTLAAHAWLEWNGEILIGAGSTTFAPLWRTRA